MVAAGNEAPVGVEDCAGEIAPFRDHGRVRDLCDRQAHLVAIVINDRLTTASVVASMVAVRAALDTDHQLPDLPDPCDRPRRDDGGRVHLLDDRRPLDRLVP